MTKQIILKDTPTSSPLDRPYIEIVKDVASLKCDDYPSHTTEFLNSNLPQRPVLQPQKIYNDICSVIGNTPMVRMSRFAKKYNLHFELLGKCEFLNPGGSVKDRIALQIIEEAENKGICKPKDVLIEASSGNTGIAFSVVANVKDYNMIVTMPQKMSKEKEDILRALGSDVIRTPTKAAWNDLNSHLSIAHQLEHALPNAHMLDQYKNPGNPRAHYFYTGEEILQQCDNKIDYVVISAGTGGTITGIAAKIKEKCPTCIVVGVDPHGSILAQPESLNSHPVDSYLVEGIGYDFIPSVLNRKYVDEWVKTSDEESLRLGRELIRTEGMLIGTSSGAALVGVLSIAHKIKQGMRCVVVLPDSSRNYLSKFISDSWMMDKGFYNIPKKNTEGTIQDILPLKSPIILHPTDTVATAMKLFNEKDVEVIVITKNNSNEIEGILTQKTVLSHMALFQKDYKSIKNINVMDIAISAYKWLPINSNLSTLNLALQINDHCIIKDKEEVIGYATQKDLVKFYVKN